jgi:hypothetical protein
MLDSSLILSILFVLRSKGVGDECEECREFVVRVLPMLWFSLGVAAVLDQTVGTWAGIVGFVAVWIVGYLLAVKAGRL